MAPLPLDQLLVPSVLDRLLDDEPGVTTEPARSRGQLLRELKLSVQRDLRDLLNTRQRCRELAEALTELRARSLVNYGIPDFTGANFTSPERRQELCRILENVIRSYQPAFQKVSVRLRDDAEPLDGTLHLHIDALLRVHPAPEPLTFDPNLELDTGNFKFE
jgi:type VI secretion system protein ImpF